MQNELDTINGQLEELLLKGSNDEALVDKKRELEYQIRNEIDRSVMFTAEEITFTK